MSDIFREVEEDVRRERYEQLWKEYGDYIIAAAAFVVIAAAGWQLWRYYEQREQMRASAEYVAAMQLAGTGQLPASAEAFGKLATTAPGGYAKVSRLQEAGALMGAGRTADAEKLYTEIASGDDEMLAAVAKIRIAWAKVDTASRAQIESQLAPLTDPANAFNPMASEILAYSDFQNNNLKNAQSEYKRLAANTKAPSELHERAAAMAAFLAAGAGRDFGTLPKPVPVKPAPTVTPPLQGTPQK